MAYLVLGAIGAALAAGAWFAWRRRRPLTILRAVLVVVILGATGTGMWLGHELEGVTRGADGAARAFGNAASFH